MTATRESRRQTLEQERASAAWGAVQQVTGAGYKKEYGSLAKSAPADIQTNGLGPTLAFWRAKGFKGGKPENNAHAQLLLHVSAWVAAQVKAGNGRSGDGSALMEWIVKEATTSEYRRATAEALAYLAWLRRFAEAELGG